MLKVLAPAPVLEVAPPDLEEAVESESVLVQVLRPPQEMDLLRELARAQASAEVVKASFDSLICFPILAYL